MVTSDNFGNQVFDFVYKQYGKQMVENIKLDRNKNTVNKLIESSSRKNDTIEHTGNKIIAMLRLNP
jgi:hypothetical protein